MPRRISILDELKQRMLDLCDCIDRQNNYIKELQAKLKLAKDDLHRSFSYRVDSCEFCAHYYPCPSLPQDCKHYCEGIGAQGENGQEYPDFKWTCQDFNFGTCGALENTPCNGCFYEDHWKWRGDE